MVDIAKAVQLERSWLWLCCDCSKPPHQQAALRPMHDNGIYHPMISMKIHCFSFDRVVVLQLLAHIRSYLGKK